MTLWASALARRPSAKMKKRGRQLSFITLVLALDATRAVEQRSPSACGHSAHAAVARKAETERVAGTLSVRDACLIDGDDASEQVWLLQTESRRLLPAKRPGPPPEAPSATKARDILLAGAPPISDFRQAQAANTTARAADEVAVSELPIQGAVLGKLRQQLVLLLDHPSVQRRIPVNPWALCGLIGGVVTLLCLGCYLGSASAPASPADILKHRRRATSEPVQSTQERNMTRPRSFTPRLTVTRTSLSFGLPLVDKIHEEPAESLPAAMPAGASSREVTIMVSNLIIGSGVLTLPHGFVLAGWVALPVMVGTVAILAFTACLLGSACGVMVGRGISDPSFGDISEAALGAWSRPVFEVFCLAECFIVCAWHFIFIGDSLAPVFGCDAIVVILVSGVICLLCFLLPRRVFTILSVLGLALTFAAAGALMVTGMELPTAQETQVLATPTCISGLMKMSAFTVFAIGDHAVFGGIYAASADEAAYKDGMVGAFAFFAVVAVVVTAVAYATFGSALKADALNNIGKDTNLQMLHGWSWLFAFANLCLSARMMTSAIPAFLRPLINFSVQAVEGSLGMDLSVPANTGSELSLIRESPKKFTVRMAFIVAVIGVVVLAASILADHLTPVETLIGSSFAVVNCFWLPCLAHWKLGNPSRGSRMAMALLLLSASTWGAIGTFDSAKAILSDSPLHKLHKAAALL